MAICKHRREASPSSKSLLVSHGNPYTQLRIPPTAVWPNTLSNDIKSTSVIFAVHRWTFRKLPHLLSLITEKSNKKTCYCCSSLCQMTDTKPLPSPCTRAWKSTGPFTCIAVSKLWNYMDFPLFTCNLSSQTQISSRAPLAAAKHAWK